MSVKWPLATDWISQERFVQQHFDVCLIAEPFGFRLLLCARNFAVTQADRNLARAGRQKLLRFAVERSAAAIKVRGEGCFRLNLLCCCFSS